MADEGVKYFPLYCVLDEKFELIEAEFGLKAFAIVVKLYQRIYGGHGYYCEWNDDIALMFARQCGLSNVGDSKGSMDPLGCADGSSQSGRSKNLIDQVVAASIRRGIFDKELFENCSILTSRGVQRNFLNIVRNRKKVEIKGEYLLLSDAEIKGNVVIIGESYVRNTVSYVRFKQSKVEESKGKENRECAQRIEEFFSAYPKTCNRHLTELAYIGLIADEVVDEDDLIECARNYAESCQILKTQERYIKNAENFLKDYYFEEFLQGHYQKPKVEREGATAGNVKKNSFNDFKQNQYDFEKLEKELLSN